MEVVLLEDVKALGKKGQIVKVSDGYGRNFILTKKLGIEATPKNLNDLKLQKANEAKIAAEHLAAAKDLAKPESWNGLIMPVLSFPLLLPFITIICSRNSSPWRRLMK